MCVCVCVFFWYTNIMYIVKYQMLVAMSDANRLVVAKSMVERCIERLASLDIHLLDNHACFVHWFVSSFNFNLIARLSSCSCCHCCHCCCRSLFYCCYCWFFFLLLYFTFCCISSSLCYVISIAWFVIKKCRHAFSSFRRRKRERERKKVIKKMVK